MNPPELSIIVPVYNEAATVVRVMKQLSAACPDAQIIYVDDGSRDASLALLKGNARAEDLVLTKPNGGKGSAIRAGLEHAEGQFTVIQDADLEYDPREIHTLVQAAGREKYDVVFGSRFLQKNPNRYKLFLLGNKVLSGCISILFFRRITDSYTCYKLLRTDLFRALNLKANGFELEAEICAKCLKRGLPIKEVPISYHPRTIEEGKKICFADAWKGILMMLHVRFSSK